MRSAMKRILPAALALATLAGCTSRVDRPNVLLVTLDTTRADRLGAYGAAGAETNAFDRLAAEGVLFERAWTVTPLTSPAHASVMTGLYPTAHGVRNNGRFRMADESTTLAEILRGAGWATGGFVAAFPVSRSFGFEQGFERFDDDFGSDAGGVPRNERIAGEVNARAIPWIRERMADRTRPFFAWIHYYDAHEPYNPPGPIGARFRGRAYAGEIAYADSCLAEVIETLRRGRVLDRTVVVVAGDHGEGLGDHGEATHGLLIYEPMIHVPLAIRAPWIVPKGSRSRELASLVDLTPTILSLAGVPPVPGLHGRTIAGPKTKEPEGGDDPLEPGAGRAVYAESFFGNEEFSWAPLVTVRRGDQKWIGAPVPERYDLESDPREGSNLSGRAPERDRAMRDLLAGVATRIAAGPSPSGAEGTPSEDLLERLQSLGYVGGGGAGQPAEGTSAATGRDPKEAVADYQAYLRGTELLGRGGAAEARSIFENLVARDPRNPEFRLRLGMACRATRDEAAAEREYRRLIDDYPRFYLAYRRLAVLLEAAGRWDESVAMWRRFLATGARFVGTEARLAHATLGAGRPEEAVAICEEALARGGESRELLEIAGRALAAAGRRDEAIERYRRLLRSFPADGASLDAAMALLRDGGRPEEALALLRDCLERAPGDPGLSARARAVGLTR